MDFCAVFGVVVYGIFDFVFSFCFWFWFWFWFTLLVALCLDSHGKVTQPVLLS